MRRLAIVLIIYFTVVSQDAVFASEYSSLRIRRPFTVSSPEQNPEQRLASIISGKGDCCSKSANGNANKGFEHNSSCRESNRYFHVDTTQPVRRFAKWLQLSLHPPLCHTVLCQRQCAYSSYQPCNALGQERSILDAVKNSKGCDGDSCCESN